MGFATLKNLRIILLVTLTGVICVLVLPGLSASWAASTRRSADQAGSQSDLERLRQSALENLMARFKAGDQFSEEEEAILRRFSEGQALSDLEADVLISRALYDHYIAGKELTKEQEELLNRYGEHIARRDHDIADLKTQLLNNRIAAAAAALPRNTPLAPPSNDLCSGAEVIPASG